MKLDLQALHLKMTYCRVYQVLCMAVSMKARSDADWTLDDLAEDARMDKRRLKQILDKPGDMNMNEICDLMVAMGLEFNFGIAPLPTLEPPPRPFFPIEAIEWFHNGTPPHPKAAEWMALYDQLMKAHKQ